MASLNDLYRCVGIGCPSKEICRRYPMVGEFSPDRVVMTALYVRQPTDAAACDEYQERDAEVKHAA